MSAYPDTHIDALVRLSPRLVTSFWQTCAVFRSIHQRPSDAAPTANRKRKRITRYFCAIFIVPPKLHNFGKLCYGAMPPILGYDAFRQTFGHATCKIIRAKHRNLQNATPRGRKPKQMQSRAPQILRRSKSPRKPKRRRRNRKGCRQSLQNKIRSLLINHLKNMNIRSLRRIMLEE